MKPKMSFQEWCIRNHAYLLLHFYQQGSNPLTAEKSDFHRESVRGFTAMSVDCHGSAP